MVVNPITAGNFAFIFNCTLACQISYSVTVLMHFTSENPKKYHASYCQNVCDSLTFLLGNIFIRVGTMLYRQEVAIPMGTNCAPLVADLFLFCYERDFMMSLSDDN